MFKSSLFPGGNKFVRVQDILNVSDAKKEKIMTTTKNVCLNLTI